MLLRGIAHGRDAHATYKHMHLITCNATYDAGGLGHLLADTVERARASGRAFRYVVGGLRAGDEAIGTVVRSRLAPLLNRLPPMRFDPGRRQWITFECFDRAAAKRIPPGVESVLAFAGQALHTFRAARRAGAGVRLELLSPTAHINHVWRQHRKAATQHPIERDWLSARHREKVLVEYETTDVILVLSDYARKTFLDAGIAAERLQRIDVTAKQRFHGAQREPSDGVFRIVYTGALTVTKGVPLLIEAFERLATRDAELILVGGSGSRGMRKFLQRAIARDGRIRIAPGDPLPHLRRADVYVHPSYQDGYAYAVAEALACGVPVIVTEDTGAKEHVIEGVNGWIVPTGDADAIHDRLRQVLASVTRASTSMRLLMCSPHPLVRELGAPKVLIELAETLREVGHTCDVIEPRDYGARPGQDRATRIDRSAKLRAYLREHASRYDGIDYDHEELPFPRDDFDPRVLMVARSVLLVDHLNHVPLGWARRMRSTFRRRARLRRAQLTLGAADLINVSNEADRATLIRRGHAREKIVVLPFGLSARRRGLFEATCDESPPIGATSTVTFVGTFDYRKGARDFPRLVEMIGAESLGTRFRLLGTEGLFRSAQDVLDLFPRALWSSIEVVPRFDPAELPKLLAGCSVGVFPSYYEGFGFGVLEMLAAAIPVVAYDAPGPPMMLPCDWLVARGDARAMATKVIELLRSDRLPQERRRARAIARRFDWTDIGRRTVDAYRCAIERRGNR